MAGTKIFLAEMKDSRYIPKLQNDTNISYAMRNIGVRLHLSHHMNTQFKIDSYKPTKYCILQNMSIFFILFTQVECINRKKKLLNTFFTNRHSWA